MIKYNSEHSLFDSDTEALVNPVNCKGVMGKGIALEFKKRFPECLPPYKQACNEGILKPGVLVYVKLNIQPSLFGYHRPGVILFPTKIHWKDASRLEWIEQDLLYLKNNYHIWGLSRIAMPQVGCGLGGLSWESVQPILESIFSSEILDITVYIGANRQFEEKETPQETDNNPNQSPPIKVSNENDLTQGDRANTAPAS